MKLLRSRPFACLALATVLLGVLWHTTLADDAGRDSVLSVVMSIVGAPFIFAMRSSSALFGDSRVTPLVGLVLGLVPYVLADWLLQRLRSSRVNRSAAAKPEQ